MSPISMIFAGLMVTACSLMIVRRTHIAVGIAMLLSLALYVQPVRAFMPFGQTPEYLLAVEFMAAMIIVIFALNTIVGRIILASISLLIIVGHIPALLGISGIKSLDYTANVVGWVQILVLFGGGNGVLIKRYLRSVSLGCRRLFALPEWVIPTPINRKIFLRSSGNSSKNRTE